MSPLTCVPGVTAFRRNINRFPLPLLLLQDKRAVERVNIDKVYHPFITGPYNKQVGEMMQETGARVNVPPPSVNKTEIVITGEKEQVALAVTMIKKIYEEKVSQTLNDYK